MAGSLAAIVTPNQSVGWVMSSATKVPSHRLQATLFAALVIVGSELAGLGLQLWPTHGRFRCRLPPIVVADLGAYVGHRFMALLQKVHASLWVSGETNGRGSCENTAKPRRRGGVFIAIGAFLLGVCDVGWDMRILGTRPRLMRTDRSGSMGKS